MRNVRSQSFARTEGEAWYELNGNNIRLERRGAAIYYEVFRDGRALITGIDSTNEETVLQVLTNRLAGRMGNGR